VGLFDVNQTGGETTKCNHAEDAAGCATAAERLSALVIKVSCGALISLVPRARRQ